MAFRIAQAEDRKLVAPLLAHSYTFAVSDVPMWLERAGHDNIYVLEEDGALAGTLISMPMGQFFGGRAVTTLGVGGVAIPVPQRGRGAAARMMIELLRTARAKKFALSTLFPSVLTPYARAGYERAGHRFRTTVDLRRIRVPKSRLRVEEHPALTDEAIRLYRKLAVNLPGHLDRGPYVWGRINAPRGAAKRAFTFHSEKRLEAYVVLAHQMTTGGDSNVTVVDAAAIDRVGGEAIWGLLAEYQSMATETVFYGGAEGFLHALLPERHYKTEWVDSWMVRVCDPALALRSRGYPPISARVTLHLTDAMLPENSGAYALAVVRGAPSVKVVKGSKSGIKITERGLAALFTGFVSPWELRGLGMLACSEDEARTLAVLFAGRAPSMGDSF